MKGKSFEYSSTFYDLLYADKDYDKEVTFIEDIFQLTHRPKNILELGCGTGSYTKRFIERGYQITGIDLSENMLAIAKQKCACEFINADMRDFSIHEKFDACIAMFAVLGYATENSHISQVFQNIREHLNNDGLLVFDVWNGLAVMRTFPEIRTKTVENKKVKLTRIATPKIRAFHHVCEVNYKIIGVNKENGKFIEFDENHTMRFYFPQEINQFLVSAGFEVLKICPFMDLNGQVDESIWNIAVIAKKSG